MWCGVALYADRLAETMRREVKVAVSGNGADEVLAGYRPYSRVPFEAALRRMISFAPDGVLNADIGLPERLCRLARSSRGPMETWRAETLAEAARAQIPKLCTPAVADRLMDQDLGAPIRAYAEECSPSSYLDTVLYTDLMAYHQHGHCTIADMSGMTYGLEIRAPFLDHRFVEFAASLPTDMLLSVLPAPQRTKQIAKRHLERYLPRDVVQAPKVGFGYAIPLNDMILGSNRETVHQRLTQGAYLDLGIFSREGAQWALTHSSSATWMLLSFSIWADRHLGGRDDVVAPFEQRAVAGAEIVAP
jgi:asparagine synthase (glutamine-hydrolysing)